MKSTRYAGGGEIEAKIQKLQTLIDNPNTPETDRKNFVEAQKKFKEKLASETKATDKPVAKKPTSTKPVARKTTTRKATAKPVAKKPTPTRVKSVTKRPSTPTKTAPVKKSFNNWYCSLCDLIKSMRRYAENRNLNGND